jgi:hypothetical protein
MEIEKAVEDADAIIVCLSQGSITKEGYVQRELRIVLDYADYKPEGTLYLMPVRLEACEPPRRLRPWQYADYFEGQRERGLQRLLVSLQRRAASLGLNVDAPAPPKDSQAKKPPAEEKKPVVVKPTSFTRRCCKKCYACFKQAHPLQRDGVDARVCGEILDGQQK